MHDRRFKDWKTYDYGRIRLFYPPGHLHEKSFEEVAKGYDRATTMIGRILAMDSIPDTITVFYFTGPNQGLEMTNHARPYADSEAIYYWPAYSRGVSLTQFLLLKWSHVEPTNKFLWHGLVALFDHAGENYHKTTMEYAGDTLFIPLAKLAVDGAINSDIERYQSAEAASFCGYVIARYGPATMKTLYESPEPFLEFAPKLLQTSIDSMQTDWLAFAQANSSAPVKN
ncbi:hypothetical protein C3F09_06800 [candidate division GN15 bacterium]|uniref:Uncharacterized protein n=1 Tax=candidate division GN15 bacterium TaxID=2072418 RepID=A0A855X6Q0_9BACT|nr:MAG: hypothetical protein C3F09_06800 [candidate division GN15 bacterium]